MNQKDLIKWGLIALGAYLVYEYIQKNGGLAAVLGGANLASPTVGQSATGAQLIAAGAPGFTGLTPGQVTQMSTETYTWDGTKWAQTTALSTPNVQPAGTTALANAQAMLAPMGITLSASQQAAILSGQVTNISQLLTPAQMAQFLAYRQANPAPTGGTVQASTPATPAGPDVRQQVLTAAVNAGNGAAPMLTLDQWCYYFAQVTGTPCPNTSSGLWSVDTSTPVDIDTWWGPMQTAGVSGFGLSAFAPSWYM